MRSAMWRASSCFPAKSDRKAPIPHDSEMCEWRRLVESSLQRIKAFRRIAARCDPIGASSSAALRLAAAFLALRGMSKNPSLTALTLFSWRAFSAA